MDKPKKETVSVEFTPAKGGAMSETRRNIGHWQPPTNAAFFGFLDQVGGFNTVRIEEICAISPEPDGRFKIWLRHGQLMMILPTSDGFALMQRLGWRQTPGLPTRGN